MEPAESVRAQLAFAGIESRITSNGGWNRIMLGPYSNRAAADKMLQRLRDRHFQLYPACQWGLKTPHPAPSIKQYAPLNAGPSFR